MAAAHKYFLGIRDDVWQRGLGRVKHIFITNILPALAVGGAVIYNRVKDTGSFECLQDKGLWSLALFAAFMALGGSIFAGVDKMYWDIKGSDDYKPIPIKTK